jgi:F-type H+-transporting ATPase subunit a
LSYTTLAGPHISVKVDEVFNAAGVSITNSHLMGFLGLIVLVWVMFRTRAAVLGKKKHNFITRLIQWTFDGLYNTICQFWRIGKSWFV